MFFILWSERNWHPHRLTKAVKAKKCAYTREYCCCGKKCVCQFTVVLNNWTFRRHHWDEFCIKTLDDVIQCSIYLKSYFLDEAHFDLGGYVNKQNCRIWGTENPHAYIEKPTHPKRVTVWCGFWSRGIIGPFFFENEQGEAVTVNGDRYRAMFNEFLFTKIQEEDIDNICYQQDGAACHTVEA